MRKERARRMRKRVLRAMTDGDLARRQARYLRGATIAEAWVQETNGLGNAVGCRNNLVAWEEAARAELERRGLRPMGHGEVWRLVRPSELTVANADLANGAGSCPEELDRVVAQFQGSSTPGRDSVQRFLVLDARLGRDRSWAEEVAERLEERIGWRMTSTEVRALVGPR